MEEFGILIFGHTRALHLADVLRSINEQGGSGFVDVWLDGHQGIPEVKIKTEMVYEVVSKFPVKKIYRHNGNLGFRKLMLQALTVASQRYQKIMVLEDDCFPSGEAIATFREQLALIEKEKDVFSVYGHHFLVPAETEYCTRFQGWGWGTTSEKLRPMLDRLIDCYSLTEERYLEFVRKSMTKEVLSRLDVTPPRQPSSTLNKFFAWDETLALLTALDGMVHKKTPQRTIYNCGASADSSRFKVIEWYRKPPFNMVPHEEVWQYY